MDTLSLKELVKLILTRSFTDSNFMMTFLFHTFLLPACFCFAFILLLRNHSKKRYSVGSTVKAGASILLIFFLSLIFFISYSFGLNAKIRHELPEKDLNKDITLLNVLYPFLYNYTSYSSDKLFNPEIFYILNLIR